MATSHPGHVGIYVGNGQIAHALGTSWWFVPDVSGEVMVTPLAARLEFTASTKTGAKRMG